MSDIDVLNKDETRYIEGVFLNSDEDETDPDSVTLLIRKPSGALVEEVYQASPSAIERTALGNFRRSTVFDEVGHWRWQWVGTGPVEDVEPGQTYVVGSGF